MLDEFMSLTKEHLKSFACQYSLTAREEQITMLLICGQSGTAIQQLLHIAPNTLKSHLKSIYQKCAVHSKQSLIDLVYQNSFK